MNMKKVKIISIILVAVLLFGGIGVFLNSTLSSDPLIEHIVPLIRIENIYKDKYEPVRVSYWKNVQQIVNQGAEVVSSKWSVGDTFIDRFNGTTVIIRLVDIAEDGTCTFMMDSVLDSPLTYSVKTWDVEDYRIPLEDLLYDDDEGNERLMPLVVKGVQGEYMLVYYEKPEQYLSFDYHWRANGMYDPEWTFAESFDFHFEYSIFSLGSDLDPSVLPNYYYLVEFELDDFVQWDWVELDLKYQTLVSEDLKRYAVDFRLPYAAELGIGDLQGHGANKDVVWDYFKDCYSYDESGFSLVDQDTYQIYYFDSVVPIEQQLKYSSFKGSISSFWLEDKLVPQQGHPSRFYVNESGKLLLVDSYMPLMEPISGSFMPCFKIKPQR